MLLSSEAREPSTTKLDPGHCVSFITAARDVTVTRIDAVTGEIVGSTSFQSGMDAYAFSLCANEETGAVVLGLFDQTFGLRVRLAKDRCCGFFQGPFHPPGRLIG